MMLTRLNKKILSAVFILVIFLLPQIVFAVTCSIQTPDGIKCFDGADARTKCSTDSICLESVGNCVVKPNQDKCQVDFGFDHNTVTELNKIKGATTVQGYLGLLIKSAMGVFGSIALVMFLYGGVTWMTAAGASDKHSTALKIMVWAALGIAVIFSSYGAVKFIFSIF